MKKKTGQMMHAGIQSVKLAVQHVRQPCQRVPIAGISGCQCPGDALERQSVLNMAIFVDVGIVIKIHKIMISCLPINGERGYNEKKTNQYITTLDYNFPGAVIYSYHACHSCLWEKKGVPSNPFAAVSSTLFYAFCIVIVGIYPKRFPKKGDSPPDIAFAEKRHSQIIARFHMISNQLFNS